MKRYFISHTHGDEKQRNVALYIKVRDNGEFIKSEWKGDYLVATYKFNNKIYEVWDNMEYGIMSEVIEYEPDEYKLATNSESV